MKSLAAVCHAIKLKVTLCVRVWIEISLKLTKKFFQSVTLCVRVWIEIA